MDKKYTWEDFERMREEMLTTRGFSSGEPILIERQRMIDYFFDKMYVQNNVFQI